MNDHDDNDALWELLGKARRTTARSRFAADVVRAIRQEPARPSLWAWLKQSWLRPALAGAVALLLVLGGLQLATGPSDTTSAPFTAASPSETKDEVASAEDMEIIINLDELIALEENAVWIEEPSYF